MRLRSAILSSLALLLVAPVANAGEVFGTIYGGARPQSTDDPALSPPSFSRSVFGVGIDVAHLPRTNRGFIARAGAAVEWEGFCAPGSCPWPPSNGNQGDVARHGEFGVHGRLGWQWPHVGFEVGAIVYSESFVHPNRTALLSPDFLVRFGTFGETWFGIGGGAYNAPTIFSPGLYGQLHVGLGPRAWLAFTGGVHQWGPWGDRPLWRFDFEGAGRIGRRWFLGGGGAMMASLHGDGAAHGELRVFAGLEF